MPPRNITSEELQERLDAMTRADLEDLLHFMNGYEPKGMINAMAAQEKRIAARHARRDGTGEVSS